MNRLTTKIDEGFYVADHAHNTDEVTHKLGQYEDLGSVKEWSLKTTCWNIVKAKRIDIESFYTSFIERDFNYDFYASFYGTYGRNKLTKEEFDTLRKGMRE